MESKNCLKEGHCYHCGRKLKASIWLDLNNLTGRWSSDGWSANESQGWFEFGPDCAAKLNTAHE